MLLLDRTFLITHVPTVLLAVSVNDPPRNFSGADVRVPVLIWSIYCALRVNGAWP